MTRWGQALKEDTDKSEHNECLFHSAQCTGRLPREEGPVQGLARVRARGPRADTAVRAAPATLSVGCGCFVFKTVSGDCKFQEFESRLHFCICVVKVFLG